MPLAQRTEFVLAARPDGNHRARGGLTEQAAELVPRQPHHRPRPARQAAFGERDGEPALGKIMRRREHARASRGDEQRAEVPFGVQVGDGRPAAKVPVRDVRPQRAAEFRAGPAEQHDRRACLAEPDRQPPPHVVMDAEHADDRGRVDGRGGGLVVEADISAGHRHATGPRTRRRARAPPR